MRNTIQRAFLCAALLCSFVKLQGGVPAFARFDKITQADGLSSNHILCIHQEKAGWLWVGTSLGLNRYDGYHFKVYKSDLDGLGTLKGELVRCIFEDKQSRIWIGTEHGGLNLFNRDLEQFSHFNFADSSVDSLFSVNSIISDNQNRIWIGADEGVAFLDENYQLQKLNLPSWKEAGKPGVTRILLDNKGNLWFGTVSGLFVYDFKTKKDSRLPLPDTDRSYDEINSLYYDTDHILWIGTYNDGVFTADPVTQTIQKFNSWIRFSRSETIRSIVEDHQGIMWFGTRGGLVAYDKVAKNFSTFLRDEDESLSLSLNSILSLCVDSKGDLWIGTRGGINYRNNDKQAFRHLKASKNDTRFLNNAEVYCFFIHGDDLLIGTESGGVNIYNTETHRFQYITTKNGLSGDCIKSFVQDGSEILVGTYKGGITVIDADTYRVKTVLRHQKNNPSSLNHDVVWGLLKDSHGNIWVVTNKGVQLYDGKTKTFESKDELFSGTSCNWIKEDAEGDLWMGGGNSLLIYNPKSGKIIRHNERTRDFIRAANNRYWVATRGHGLALYEKEKGAVKYYTEADGLCNNTLQSLIRDKTGNVWISTLNGLSCFNEKTSEFINFDASDGLQDNQFNYGAAIQNKQRQLIYGGINGINIFNPEDVRMNFYIPQVVLTELRVFNQPVTIGSIIKKSISVADKIVLNHKQNVFSIEFAALSFANSSKNMYKYKMEGFDKDWIQSGFSNSATYTNLDPGKYTFKLKGSNSNGVWSEKETSIEIMIKPPFWKTWWFELIMAMVVICFLVYLGNFYLKRVRLKNELVFEKTKARKLHEIEAMKLRFFTNISHEIRTPLTLILGPLNQVIEQGSVDGESKGKLQLVKRNADQLLKLINQLLDFRKLEAGKHTIHYEKADIMLFVRSILESFQAMALDKGVNLTLNTGMESFIGWFDGDKLQKILNNLLSNALKFTDAGGLVEVIFNATDNPASDVAGKTSFYSISVRDSGKGIPAKNIGKIFERFEQASNTKDYTGSGIGLSITREFVKLMGGDIEVESAEGSGSTFVVRLPVLSDAEVDVETKDPVLEKAGENIATEGGENIVLIVEDNADVREYTASIFRSEYKILEAVNGREGFEMAVQHIPDIIISDLLMPEMNGDAFCKKIKKEERTSHIPFILLTAVTSRESEKEALKIGADDYITKPFDINILRIKVDNLLSLRNTLRDKYKNDFLMQPSAVTLVSPEEKFLKKAVDIIEKYIDDPDFDIERFASEIGASRMQLYRKLEALTNMTVKEFIRDIRIKRAAQLLEQNKLTVSEIVYQVGFRDLAYFRKCFRDQYGVSPSEYASKFKK